MKRFILFFSFVLAAGNLSLSAEESKPQGLPEPPVEAVPATSEAAPEAAPVPPAGLEKPLSLIPDNLPNLPNLPKELEGIVTREHVKKLKNARDDSSADGLKRRIHLREVQNQALKDDKLQVDLNTAKAAKTDTEKRAALKRYYNALFDRMIKIDPNIKSDVETRRRSYLARYDQNRVRAAGEPSDFDQANDQ